jgi:cell division protein ZapA
MAHVNVSINGRQYRMACEEGQEDRLMRLAEGLERRIGSLRGKFGEIGDSRLTVMAALMLADELVDVGQRVRRLEDELQALQDARIVVAERNRATNAALVTAFNAAADRIEKMTQSLNRTLGGGVAIG